jgi:pilus assembly protein Flp/PilA
MCAIRSCARWRSVMSSCVAIHPPPGIGLSKAMSFRSLARAVVRDPPRVLGLLGGRLAGNNGLTMPLLRFLKDETGATAIEYAIIAAGISIVMVVAVQAIGTNLNAKFTSVAAGLK